MTALHSDSPTLSEPSTAAVMTIQQQLAQETRAAESLDRHD
jgi:hypothetical protein